MSSPAGSQLNARLQAPADGGTPQVFVLPKHLDEKVARLHLDAVGAKLTTLSKQQAEYIGVDVAGPFKPDTYRY